jgi:hypothetical protein
MQPPCPDICFTVQLTTSLYNQLQHFKTSYRPVQVHAALYYSVQPATSVQPVPPVPPVLPDTTLCSHHRGNPIFLVFQNIDPPSPSPPGECVPPPLLRGEDRLAGKAGHKDVNSLTVTVDS